MHFEKNPDCLHLAQIDFQEMHNDSNNALSCWSMFLTDWPEWSFNPDNQIVTELSW